MKTETNFALEPGQSVTLKHRVLILSGPTTADQLGAQYKRYTDGKTETNFALEPGQSVTLKHRVLILSGPETPEQLAAQYKRYTDEVK